MWGTNFPQWIGGDMEFRFEISSFERTAGDEKKAWMQMLEDCGPAGAAEGMKLIGARKSGKGVCLYFSEIWGKDGKRSFSAEGCRICLPDLLGRSGAFHENRITFDAAAYGVQCIYLERESGNE